MTFSATPARATIRGIARALRRALPAALALCASATAAAAQSIPDSPLGRRMSSILALGESGDTAAIRAFIERESTAQVRARPFEENARILASARNLRGARVVELRTEGPSQLRAILEAGDRRWELVLVVEENAPYAVAGLEINPAPMPAPEALTVAQVREVVDSIAVQVERNYVAADTGRLIAAHVRARMAAGAYDALTRPAELAERLDTDLRSVNGDQHLYVYVNTAGAGGGAAPWGDAPRRSNYGLRRVERLVGNVGYLRLTSFSGDPRGRDAAVNALRFLAGTDAMILDVRGVPGGSARMANFLISHFTAPGVPSLQVYERAGDRTETRLTLDSVPGPRRTDVPLYVLTDRGSASAAEDVPFVLQNLGRATIVGDRTAGAGRNNEGFPAAHGMNVSVSVSRVTDPRSGREWERVGVVPDIASAPEQALAVAHQDALRKLAAAEPDEAYRAVLTAVAEYVAAQAAPVPLPAELLDTYAGTYADARIVTVRDGRLYYQVGADQVPEEMVALGGGRFAAGPTLRIAFTEERMEVAPIDEQPRVFARVRQERE